MHFNASKLHGLELTKNQSFFIGDVEVTPYQIGTERIDFWFIRTTIIRPYRHLAFAAMPAAHQFLMHHLKDNCFGNHFRFHGSNKTMFYIETWMPICGRSRKPAPEQTFAFQNLWKPWTWNS
jgi:hypothetical protein